MCNKPKDIPQMLVRPPFIYAGTIVLGVVIHINFPRPLAFNLPVKTIGIIVCICAVIILIQCFTAFRKAKTPLNPGRSTTAIVEYGPYRLSRNPIYVALFVLHVGIALVVNSFWILVMLLPLIGIIHFGVVLPEERYLEEKFGETYQNYKNRVTRWL